MRLLHSWPARVLIAVAFVAAGLGRVALAQADPFLGTWKLDLAKSTYSPGPAPKSLTVTYSKAGPETKVVVDGVGGDGSKTHWEYTAAVDGKDYKMTGNPDGDTVSLKQINPRTVDVTYKRAGKPMLVNRRTLSADGKTLTVTTTGTNAKGETVKNVQVFGK